MSFNSPQFLFFLLLVVSINYFLSPYFRTVFLIFVSFCFIGYFNLESLLALAFFSVLNFYLGKKIANKRPLYILGLSLNVFAIVLFNYFSATPNGVVFSFSILHFNVNSFIIALGLSFYSLQNISYLTEVYFGRLVPQGSISKYVLYCSFFPKIISGPVTLPNEFFPQIERSNITKQNLLEGFNRFLLGLFKKMVIADRLAPSVHSIFDFGDNYSGLTTIVGVYLFTIQLYFDFSAYTDMALGTAKMLGYNLKENFNLPLRSTSISDFWRRWHISLITWFTNYIYYPVVYKFRSHKKMAVFIGILITFFTSGIWHGIGYTFLAWAFCHIVFLCFEVFTKKSRLNFKNRLNKRIHTIFSIFIVFNAVCFSNIFFRAHSFSEAIQLIKNVFSHFWPNKWLNNFIAPLAIGGHQIEKFNFFTSIFLAIIVLLFERKINLFGKQEKFQITFFITIILLIMLFGIFNNSERFIYMQF